MIKVANVIEEGRLAGPQIRIAEVARKLKGCGVETTVIFPFSNSCEFQKRLETYEVEYLQLPLNRPTKVKKQLLRYVLFFVYEIWLLFRTFRKHKFDVVHVSGGSLQFKGIIAGHLAGSKVIWHLNDTQMPSLVRIFFKTFADRFTDGFIVAGEKVKKYYLEDLKVGKGKPSVEIQAPVDCEFFNALNVESDQRISSNDGFNIVSIGNINPFKGFEYFLRMAKELNKEYSNLNFWIVGPVFESQSDYFNKLMDLKKRYGLDNCYFYGVCHDVRQVLKSADIYVCSSIAEASPTSVWEAMSMGKAIVSTDVGDVPRFVRNEKNGYIVPVGDSLTMSTRVKALIENSDQRNKFGQLSKQTAIEKLNIKNCARAHKETYYRIINHSNAMELKRERGI